VVDRIKGKAKPMFRNVFGKKTIVFAYFINSDFPQSGDYNGSQTGKFNERKPKR
jgi:hypothetical protein